MGQRCITIMFEWKCSKIKSKQLNLFGYHIVAILKLLVYYIRNIHFPARMWVWFSAGK